MADWPAGVFAGEEDAGEDNAGVALDVDDGGGDEAAVRLDGAGDDEVVGGGGGGAVGTGEVPAAVEEFGLEGAGDVRAVVADDGIGAAEALGGVTRATMNKERDKDLFVMSGELRGMMDWCCEERGGGVVDRTVTGKSRNRHGPTG